VTRDDTFDTLPGVLSPRLYLYGNGSDLPQNGTPALNLSAVIATPASGGSPPAPALAVGLLALLWVWVLDGAVLSLRVRGLARGRADAARRDACRCRVCTLRIQARGLPLHDVSGRGAGAKKALRGWSLAWYRYPRQAD
jgi:hypothetical protein